jgi:hypothetical protein
MDRYSQSGVDAWYKHRINKQTICRDLFKNKILGPRRQKTK